MQRTLDFDGLDNRWLAVQVRSGWEVKSARGLRERGYQEFVPLYQRERNWSDRTKVVQTALFPGYVFARFSIGNLTPIVSVPGVIRLVGAGNRPVPIDDSEVEALQTTNRTGITRGPCSFLEVGQQVEVRSGALFGMRGTLVRFGNKQRLVISVSVLKQSMFVEIDGCDVVAAPPAYVH